MTDLTQWAPSRAPTLTDEDWPRVELLDAELDMESLVLSTGDVIGKPQARALLAYRDEVAADPRVRDALRPLGPYPDEGTRCRNALDEAGITEAGPFPNPDGGYPLQWRYTAFGRAVARKLEASRG